MARVGVRAGSRQHPRGSRGYAALLRSERYAWLRRSVFVGTLTPVETGNAVRLQFFRVT